MRTYGSGNGLLMARIASCSRVIAVVLCWASATPAQSPSDRAPLPSWKDGPAKAAIVAFVGRVTTAGSPDFVSPAERIATFHNDGTLWSEQPIYFQFAFALDRVKALAPQHPDWRTTQPYKAVLDGDLKALAAAGEKGLAQPMMATHTGMTTDEFTKTVKSWLATARHPRFQQPYGNSDGDQQMLEWTAAGKGARFMGLVRHTDADREWSYERRSRIGKLDTALDEAASSRWTVVDMRRDWKLVYPDRSTRARLP